MNFVEEKCGGIRLSQVDRTVMRGAPLGAAQVRLGHRNSLTSIKRKRRVVSGRIVANTRD